MKPYLLAERANQSQTGKTFIYSGKNSLNLNIDWRHTVTPTAGFWENRQMVGVAPANMMDDFRYARLQHARLHEYIENILCARKP